MAGCVIVMPYSFIKRIGMLTFLLESSVKIFLEAKHSLSNQLSKCFFLLLSSGLLTFSLDCRYHIEPPNWKQTIAKKQIYLSFLPLCTNNALPPPWQASLITLRRAKGLGEPAASTSTVCRLQPASGLRTTARQSCNFPFVSHACYNLIFHKSLQLL